MNSAPWVILKLLKKKEYFGLNSFFMSDVSLGVAFVVLEVLIATSPPPLQGNTGG